MFKKARQWPLCPAESSSRPHTPLQVRFNLTPSNFAKVSSGLFSSDTVAKIPYNFFIYPKLAAYSTHNILCDLIAIIEAN
jgi:hypothetical protein